MKQILAQIENLILWKHAKKSRYLEIKFENERIRVWLYDNSINYSTYINLGDDIPDLEEENIKAEKEIFEELRRKYEICSKIAGWGAFAPYPAD